MGVCTQCGRHCDVTDLFWFLLRWLAHSLTNLSHINNNNSIQESNYNHGCMRETWDRHQTSIMWRILRRTITAELCYTFLMSHFLCVFLSWIDQFLVFSSKLTYYYFCINANHIWTLWWNGITTSRYKDAVATIVCENVCDLLQLTGC